jgi:hypothetical protein
MRALRCRIDAVPLRDASQHEAASVTFDHGTTYATNMRVAAISNDGRVTFR